MPHLTQSLYITENFIRLSNTCNDVTLHLFKVTQHLLHATQHLLRCYPTLISGHPALCMGHPHKKSHALHGHIPHYSLFTLHYSLLPYCLTNRNVATGAITALPLASTDALAGDSGAIGCCGDVGALSWLNISRSSVPAS
jgi:hypothetical protein